jgi:hypothetical protein
MLSVENKSIMLSVVMLSVVAPCIWLEVAPMLLATGLAGLAGLAGVDSGSSSNMRIG